MAASYEARAHGVRGAMGGAQARRLCPQAVVVEPRFSAYVEASKAVFDVFERTAPLVEGLSMEEAFLDVRGLGRISGSPLQIAMKLRADVLERVGLPITVGVASTKVLAKIASGVAKPDGLLAVPAGSELGFLHRLPVERLWGVGPATAERLHDLGITNVGELAGRSEEALVSSLGRASGRHLHHLAHNRDPRRVRAGRRRRSIGSQSALGRSSHSPRPWTPGSSRWSIASPGGCGHPDGSAEPWCSDCASATSRVRPARTRFPVPRRPPGPSWRSRGRCLRGDADGPPPRSHARRSDGREPRVRGRRRPAEAPIDRRVTDALDAALDELRERFGPEPSPGRRWWAADRACRRRCSRR